MVGFRAGCTRLRLSWSISIILLLGYQLVTFQSDVYSAYGQAKAGLSPQHEPMTAANATASTTTSSPGSSIPYIGQIQEDLSWYSEKGITEESLDRVEEYLLRHSDPGDVVRFHVRRRRLYISFPNATVQDEFARRSYARRWQGMLALLAFSASGCGTAAGTEPSMPTPDLDGILYCGDGMPHDDDDDDNNDNSSSSFPLFGFQKKRQAPGILVPYFLFWNENLARMAHRMDHAGGGRRRGGGGWSGWDQKKDVLFWRGATTGAQYTRDNWRDQARSRAVLICRDMMRNNRGQQQHQEAPLCDVAFHKLVQMDEDIHNVVLNETGGLKDGLPIHLQMQHKYLLSMDGNGPCSGRFEKFIAGSSAVFKVDSDHIEFYYVGLQPNVHYLPVWSNLSNLPQQLQWAHTHQTEVQTMVRRMRDFSKSIYAEPVTEYVSQLLREYAQLLRWNVSNTSTLQHRIVRPIYPKRIPPHRGFHWSDVGPATCRGLFSNNPLAKGDPPFQKATYLVVGKPIGKDPKT